MSSRESPSGSRTLAATRPHLNPRDDLRQFFRPMASGRGVFLERSCTRSLPSCEPGTQSRQRSNRGPWRLCRVRSDQSQLPATARSDSNSLEAASTYSSTSFPHPSSASSNSRRALDEHLHLAPPNHRIRIVYSNMGRFHLTLNCLAKVQTPDCIRRQGSAPSSWYPRWSSRLFWPVAWLSRLKKCFSCAIRVVRAKCIGARVKYPNNPVRIDLSREVIRHCINEELSCLFCVLPC